MYIIEKYFYRPSSLFCYIQTMENLQRNLRLIELFIASTCGFVVQVFFFLIIVVHILTYFTHSLDWNGID